MAIVERWPLQGCFNKSEKYGYRRPIGTENRGHCEEVAAIERWQLLEVRQCIL